MADDVRLSFYLNMAIDALSRPFPYYWPTYLTDGVELLKKPDELFPVFHRAFDWHSCVHGYWCLARILRLRPELPQADKARNLLATSLTADKLAGELETLNSPAYKSFERPYGLGWLCKLAAELLMWPERPSESLSDAISPLAEMASDRIITWHQRLTYPVLTGEHNQSAFGLLLLRDYGKAIGSCALLDAIDGEIRRLYLPATLSMMHAEPSGHDFLSPSLGCALLVGNVLTPEDYALWLQSYFPTLTDVADGWLKPAVGHNAGDGKLSHLIGLNFSRAWMLRMIAGKLPPEDGRVAVLNQTSTQHSAAAHQVVDPQHFESSHWLATFAVFELSEQRT